MSILAIGDLQGCYDPFRRLLDRAKFDPAQDRLWLVGDLVNRGPQNVEILRYVKSLGDAATVVLGNHDLYLLMLAEGYGKSGKDDTLSDVLKAPDRDELLDWLRHRPLMHLEGEYALVHAGLLPAWSAERARRLAAEVEEQLQAKKRKDYRAFLSKLWGSEPARWSNHLKGPERWRVIVNAMTRMRFCSLKGAMDFKAKGEISHPPAGCLPWFRLPDRKSAAVTVVCGHWSALGLVVEPNFIALDSGCLWGRQLSAIRLPSRDIVQEECGAACPIPKHHDASAEPGLDCD